MKSKLLVLLEVLVVFALVQLVVIPLRRTAAVQWEFRNLGWSYLAMIPFIGIPALAAWLTRRKWAEYGVSCADWPTNLDVGLKAFLVRFIPLAIGQQVASRLVANSASVARGAVVALFDVAAVAVMLWLLGRQKPVASGRRQLISVGILLLVPLAVALAVGKLSVIILSTVIWQFVFSGFGEEFVYRGYYQSRLNQAFGRPWRFFGVDFGAGLILTSMLFGLLHAFNTYDPAVGLTSMSWGWALSSAAGGLFFGVLREKTGTLLAPAIAHGLPDALGEPLMKMFTWMAT